MPFLSRKSDNLSLTDYNNIWSKFCFMDESGSLENKIDPFFTIGFIKCSQPAYILDILMRERQKFKFYDELKFNKLSRKNIDFAKLALDIYFRTESLYFYSYSSDKAGSYFKQKFSSNPWQAYEDITVKMLEPNIAKNEIVILLADYISTPVGTKFEVNTKRRINDLLGRLALAGICRIDSRGIDLLQLTDLIIGAINYDLKLLFRFVSGDKYKIEFLDYFKSKLNIKGENFSKGFQNKTSFNIFVDKDIQKRLLIAKNR